MVLVDVSPLFNHCHMTIPCLVVAVALQPLAHFEYLMAPSFANYGPFELFLILEHLFTRVVQDKFDNYWLWF
jgi:hypothetical protein